MKKIKTVTAVLLILCMLMFTACGNSSETKVSQDPKQGAGENDVYSFVYNNIKITPNDYTNALVNAIGEQYDYRESASCAYIGLDKCYIYSNFTIYTYPDEKSDDHILQFVITSNQVATPEDLKLGDSVEKVTSLYGNDYTDINGSFKYVKGDTSLQIIAENGIVTSIQYWYLDD